MAHSALAKISQIFEESRVTWWWSWHQLPVSSRHLFFQLHFWAHGSCVLNGVVLSGAYHGSTWRSRELATLSRQAELAAECHSVRCPHTHHPLFQPAITSLSFAFPHREYPLPSVAHTVQTLSSELHEWSVALCTWLAEVCVVTASYIFNRSYRVFGESRTAQSLVSRLVLIFSFTNSDLCILFLIQFYLPF